MPQWSKARQDLPDRGARIKIRSASQSTPNQTQAHLLKVYFFGLSGFIDRTAEGYDKKQVERGHSKGPQTETSTLDSEDKATVHGTPAPPTELNGTTRAYLLTCYTKFTLLQVPTIPPELLCRLARATFDK